MIPHYFWKSEELEILLQQSLPFPLITFKELLRWRTQGMFFMSLNMLWKDKINNLEMISFSDTLHLDQNHHWENEDRK